MIQPTDTARRASTITDEVMSEISRQKELAAAAEVALNETKSTSRIQDVAFVLSMLCCLVLTGLNVTGKMPFRTSVDSPEGAEAERLTLQTLNFAVRAIDAYRNENGELPRTLIEVGAPADPRWTYEVIQDNRYRVEFRAEPRPLAYDSSSDPDLFFAAVRGGR